MEFKDKSAQLLLKKAEGVLEVVREYEKDYPDVYDRFILGKKTFAIISQNPVSGIPEHNIWAVMETIYDDFRKHPERKINEKLQEVLESTLRSEQNRTYLKNAIEELLYQMNSEKQNTAPFKLDCKMLLENLKSNVIDNKNTYEMNDMISELKNYNQRLEQNYNQRIM